MRAPKVAKPQTTARASSANSVARDCPTFVVSQSLDDQATPRGQAPHALSWDLSKVPVFPPERSNGSHTPSRSARPVPAIIQRKLIVGQVNDPFEHEADRVADEVVRAPVRELSIGAAPTQISRKCDCEQCADCQEEDEQLLRKPSDAAGPVSAEAPSVVHEVLRSPGQPLDTPTRAFFEARFRHDFTRVRVHTDAQATASARAVQARAYTVGPDIVFGQGQYAPATQNGQRLLAHELTHVVQQSASPAVSPIGGAGATRLMRQPQLTGSELTLTAPEPRSLRESLDVGVGLAALALEVKLIQQWLDAHPQRNQQSDHLRAELRRLQRGLNIASMPFEGRFYRAWHEAGKALRKEVFERDKAVHDSSITRGLMKVKQVAVSPEAVWKHGIAESLFLEGEKKRVVDWSEQMASKTFDERYESAKYGKIHGDERRYDPPSRRRDDTEIWKRGFEYGLFLPSEKAAVLRIPYAGTAAASALIQQIRMVDPKSPQAAILIDQIHDFTKDPAVVLLGPEVEKLLGPFGYEYHGNVDAPQVAAEINKAYAKSLPPGQVRHAGSTKQRWDECLWRRDLGTNNLEQAEFNQKCFQSEDEFLQELTRRIKEFRERYRACGHSGPDDYKCMDRVAAEYFPREHARRDAIRSWAYAELQTYKGVVAGGVVSQSGFHFAHDVLGWSTQRSAAFGGALSTVAGLGRVYVERRAALQNPPSNTPQPPTPITEVVKKPEPMPKPDRPGGPPPPPKAPPTPNVGGGKDPFAGSVPRPVDLSNRPPVPTLDPRATTKELQRDVDRAQQYYDRLRQQASDAEKATVGLRNTARAMERRGQQLTQQQRDQLEKKRLLAQARDEAFAQLKLAQNRLKVVQPAEGPPKYGAGGLAQEPKYVGELVARGLRAKQVDAGTPVIDAAILGTPEVHSVKTINRSPGADADVRSAEKDKKPINLARRVARKINESVMDRGSDKWSRLRNQWNTSKRETFKEYGYPLPKNPDEINFVVVVRVVTAKAPSPATEQAVEAELAKLLSKNSRVPPRRIFTWRIIYTTE
jgi:Domain of unknown function (DUF4157)